MKQEMLHRYLAYSAYRDRMRTLQGHAKQVDAAANALLAGGRFDAVYQWCEINLDWIEVIEAGLDHIRNAINEQRQFISREGSVVPIEKARRVSKESTVHLAKHSELLSSFTDERVTPEKIYVKENESNFFVYENKFLYMALCYLRDFVDIRYQNIVEADNTYNLHLHTDAAHTTKEKKIAFKLDYHETSADDAYKAVSEQNIPIIDRIQAIRFSVSSFLNTELMVELSKAPMLQPPVTPTNVLRMDHDFHEVYQLYTTIISYPDRGFTVHEKKLSLSPLPKNIAEDLGELLLLCSFLSHMHGSEAEEEYKAHIEKEAIEAQKRALLDATARVDELRARIGTEEDYITALEKHALSLEARRDEWLQIAEKNEILRHTLTSAEKSYEALQSVYRDSQNTCAHLQKETHLAVERAREAGRLELGEREKHFHDEMREQSRLHETEATALRDEIAELRETLAEKEARLATLTEESQILTAKLRVSDPARLLSTDFTDEATFNALEREKRAYDRFFDKAWRKAKAHIRREHLWKKPKEAPTPKENDTGDAT